MLNYTYTPVTLDLFFPLLVTHHLHSGAGSDSDGRTHTHKPKASEEAGLKKSTMITSRQPRPALTKSCWAEFWCPKDFKPPALVGAQLYHHVHSPAAEQTTLLSPLVVDHYTSQIVFNGVRVIAILIIGLGFLLLLLPEEWDVWLIKLLTRLKVRKKEEAAESSGDLGTGPQSRSRRARPSFAR